MVPKIVNVVKQKSHVMQIFADISEVSIKDMVNSINKISIHEIAYGAHYDLKKFQKIDKVCEESPILNNDFVAIRNEPTKQIDSLAVGNLTTQNVVVSDLNLSMNPPLQRLAKRRECLSHSG